jgi:hypothetical protein
MKDLLTDPFGECTVRRQHRRLRLVGGEFTFESASPALLRLVDQAFAGLPRYRFGKRSPRFRVALVLKPRTRRYPGVEPPPVRMISGNGFLHGAMDADNFAVMSPRERQALIVVSSDMLRFAHHLRYELIEFAVLTLAARAQKLVSLHAACVGRRGRGILLMGSSGAGKSTLCLQALADGLDFLAEDSVFVEPGSLRAAAVPNFLHVRRESLRWLPRSDLAAAIRRSPRIRRRSGIRKFALDLRSRDVRLAPRIMRLVAVVFLTKFKGRDDRLLVPLARDEALRSARSAQVYAANHDGWKQFERSIGSLPTFRLKRGAHPAHGVACLRQLLREAG